MDINQNIHRGFFLFRISYNSSVNLIRASAVDDLHIKPSCEWEINELEGTKFNKHLWKHFRISYSTMAAQRSVDNSIQSSYYNLEHRSNSCTFLYFWKNNISKGIIDHVTHISNVRGNKFNQINR